MWQNELHGDTQCSTDGGANQAHRGGLRDVNRQHLSTRSAEASHHGYRVDLALDECADAAGDANAAEQQRDETYNSNEVRKILDRVRSRGLSLRDCSYANLFLRE